jgi:hypothetical protein
VLKKFQLTEDLALTEVLQYAHNPTAVSPFDLFGETSLLLPLGPPSTSLRKSGEETPPNVKGRKITATPKDDTQNRKYSEKSCTKKAYLTYSEFASLVPKQMQTVKWFHTFLKVNATAVTVRTWNKYP